MIWRTCLSVAVDHAKSLQCGEQTGRTGELSANVVVVDVMCCSAGQQHSRARYRRCTYNLLLLPTFQFGCLPRRGKPVPLGRQ